MKRLKNRGKASAAEMARRLRIVPTSLDIYMTDACNMRCRYCASRSFIEGGGARTLPLADLLRGVDIFAALVAPAARGKAGDPAHIREVSFTGGEPLMRFELLKAAVVRIRRKYKWLKLTVFTNGTLLDPEKAAFLLANGVRLIVSLDGGRAVNDCHRKLLRGGSAFDAVAANLRRLTPAQRAGVHLMATFTERTVGSLAETVELFKTFKCRDIHLGLDVYEDWAPRGLRSLRSALAAFRGYCLRGLSSGPGPERGWEFNFYFKDRVSACLDLTPSNSFTLSPDGLFYPCDELCVAGAPARKYAVGDVSRGLDLYRLERVYARVAALIEGRDKVNGVLSPIDRYYRALLAGKDPASSLRNSGRVTGVFVEELGGLIDVERIFKGLAHAAGFGDFSHEPRCRARGEVRALRLGGAWTGGGPGRARAAADYFLYSRGVKKELLLGGGAFGDGRLGLALYSALKARKLGKRLRVGFETGGPARGVPS